MLNPFFYKLYTFLPFVGNVVLHQIIENQLDQTLARNKFVLDKLNLRMRSKVTGTLWDLEVYLFITRCLMGF